MLHAARCMRAWRPTTAAAFLPAPSVPALTAPPPPPPLQSLDKAFEGAVDVWGALRSARFDPQTLNQVRFRFDQLHRAGANGPVLHIPKAPIAGLLWPLTTEGMQQP
jgi:hypothetical protein